MKTIVKINAKVKDAVTPFIFLSDVLHEYGFGQVRLKTSPENGSGVDVESELSFSAFLACEIEKYEICLFDVHSLKLVSGSELKEVLQFLKNLGDADTRSIAIESGRDYCLDRQKTIQVVRLIDCSMSTSVINKRKAHWREAASAVIKREAEPLKNATVSEWADPEEPLSLEFLQLKLAEGRIAAKREKDYCAIPGGGPAAKAAKRASVQDLPVGAVSPSDNRFIVDDAVYFAGKFNRKGLPALWMEFPEDKRARSRQLMERDDDWQNKLKEMFLLHKAKGIERTHTELCIELAKVLNASRGLRGKEVNPSTIRTNTLNPSGKGPGGRYPKRT